MSLTGDRQAIAAALSGVTGVKGYAKRPIAPRTGDAWPLIGGLERGPANLFEVTWRVALVLPPDEQAASDWFDNNHEALADALLDVGYVDRIEPAVLNTEGGDKDIMLITMRAEA